MKLFDYFKSNKKLLAENDQLKEDVRYYKEQWCKCLDSDIRELECVKVVAESAAKQKKQIDDIAAAYEVAINILSAYSLWDDVLIQVMQRGDYQYPYEKGPATMYLEKLGLAEEKQAKPKKSADSSFADLVDVKRDIKGKN